MINISQLQILTARSKEKYNLNKICTRRTSLAAVTETDMIPKALLIYNHAPDTASFENDENYHHP